MLQTLNIKNVALVDNATLNFDSKLNVISGETGAGKSIMLDSLSFVFGGRSDKSLIRTGENKMKVEAIFTGLSKSHIQFVKDQLGIECGEEMFLSRELDINGKNVCKINGELVPVAMVKKICLKLVDVHGQSEHLAILDNDYQLKIIDLFSKSADSFLIRINQYIEKIHSIDAQIKSLGGDEKEKQNLIDLYSYQIEEIANANIKPNEFEQLTEEKHTMQQFEKINENLQEFLSACYKNAYSNSAVENISTSEKLLNNLTDFGEKYSTLANRIKSVEIELNDINETALEILNNNVFDQERFDFIDSRLDLIKSLFRKYGGNYENMIEYLHKTEDNLFNLNNSAELYQKLHTEREQIVENLLQEQEKLTDLRKKTAKILCKKMEDELRTLGMPNAQLDIKFERIAEQYSSTGADRVDFMFSSNLGFELKELNKVVSGGEISRVMLAYKIVVSEVDEIQTIVFDEIDSGLSGNIAMVVAEYMARLSKNKQIIAVSHLPQICAMADNNLKVEKHSAFGTTKTQATHLEGENLFAEIARLMGVASTNTTVAAELKQKCNNYKQAI